MSIGRAIGVVSLFDLVYSRSSSVNSGARNQFIMIDFRADELIFLD